MAVLAQGLVFGLFHAYQGWRNVIVISVLGVLYGILAAWRRNLQANVIVHAWGDVWSGWLRFVVWGRDRAIVIKVTSIEEVPAEQIVVLDHNRSS